MRKHIVHAKRLPQAVRSWVDESIIITEAERYDRLTAYRDHDWLPTKENRNMRKATTEVTGRSSWLGSLNVEAMTALFDPSDEFGLFSTGTILTSEDGDWNVTPDESKVSGDRTNAANAFKRYAESLGYTADNGYRLIVTMTTEKADTGTIDGKGKKVMRDLEPHEFRLGVRIVEVPTVEVEEEEATEDTA